MTSASPGRHLLISGPSIVLVSAMYQIAGYRAVPGDASVSRLDGKSPGRRHNPDRAGTSQKGPKFLYGSEGWGFESLRARCRTWPLTWGDSNLVEQSAGSRVDVTAKTRSQWAAATSPGISAPSAVDRLDRADVAALARRAGCRRRAVAPGILGRARRYRRATPTRPSSVWWPTPACPG